MAFNPKEHSSGLAEVINERFAMEIKPLQKRIAELEERVSTLEAQRTAAMKYCGIWEATRQYDEGNTATHAGGIWYANTRTTQKPGNGSGDWTLACKSGDRR